MVASNTNAYLDASSLAQEVALEKIKASIHDFLKKCSRVKRDCKLNFLLSFWRRPFLSNRSSWLLSLLYLLSSSQQPP